jgi:hypothetical protein
MDLPRISYPITFNGRTFTVEELRVTQTLTRDCAGLLLTELEYTLSELLDWGRPTGKLKNHEARLPLERLDAKGLVGLPSVREAAAHRGPRRVLCSAQAAPAPSSA